MIKRLSYYTVGSAKGYLSDWYKQNNPYERGKENLINVELKIFTVGNKRQFIQN